MYVQFTSCVYGDKLKVNNRVTRTRCEICSKLTIKSRAGVFIVNFEHISHSFSVFIVNFEQVNVGWEFPRKYIEWVKFVQRQ